ncbi:DsbA family oxidoreductase [Myxococcota bacterium]|nr:DsbA family oxidoreductase [Myxococcota bacterium]
MNELRLDVWSDIACPWCYIGKRRLEKALARFPHAQRVRVVWRSFELDPQAPRILSREQTYAERLAKKYRTSTREAEQMIQRVVDVAAQEGLELRFDRAQAGNTFDAHRVLHLAARRGLQGVAKERLLRAYFTEGEAMGDHETLVRLGAEVGLDRDALTKVLASGEYSDEVRADEEEARENGISGVPFFVLGGRYGVSGAQPTELLERALDRAWTELGLSALEPVAAAEGATCGPDGGC